ncbi:hypothetical protein T484DRAFT_2695151 [Baffinella frigidus]|nr:hypothetical protein T484DRAFT_2695151 [Cryptophyta sp. CCMP2293]
MDQIHKRWCTLLDPELEALHQRDAFVVTENRQAFLVGLLVLASTVVTAFIDIYIAAGRPPVFLLALTVVVIVASVFLATLAWNKELHRRNFNRVYVALQICCYVTPVLEHLWGGLDTFAYHSFLEFFMTMVVFTSIYAVTCVKAHVFTSIVMTVIYVPLCVANGGFVVYLTSRFVYHACGRPQSPNPPLLTLDLQP